MQVEIKYFGMIAEKTAKSSEKITFDKDVSLIELKENLETQYPSLKAMHYTFAVDMELTSDFEQKISRDCEIALLPAFAGG